MTGGDFLCGAVRVALEVSKGFLPMKGLGILAPEGPEHVTLTYVDALGATAYRLEAHDVPSPLRNGATGFVRVDRAALESHLRGVVGSRLLQPEASDEIRQVCSVREVIALPIPGHDGSILVLGLAESRPVSDDQRARIQRLAAGVTDSLTPTTNWEDELALLRRLNGVEMLLPVLMRVLDVREIFDNLSAITKDVLRHDWASLIIFHNDLTTFELFAKTSDGPVRHETSRMPYPVVETKAWLFRVFDDLRLNPLERQQKATRAGGRTSIRVAVRSDEIPLGALDFTSREATPYSTADLIIARRIADYVGLALSHQRLAEESRSTAALRERAANLELLDELLATITGSGGVSEVFDRILVTAQRLLRHDAAAVWIRMADGRHARVHASNGLPTRAPETIDVPTELLQHPDWEYDIVDDLAHLTGDRHVTALCAGFQSLLRVPVRLDARFAGALVFLSSARSAFTSDDVLVARRLADRIAVTVARDRELAESRRADEATARAARLEARVRTLTEELDARTGYRLVVGDSPQWHHVLTQAAQVAPTETTVLLLGESGTGKEVVARLLHRGSPRRAGPFIALNCAALPEQLLEAELFGYERGAYTGATQSKPGQLELAAGGTLFLDEVAEMSLSAQAKFLRVLQEREFQRLGGTRPLRANARVVAATNRDLHRSILNGQFREDLYYRLNVFAIRLPPLRDRRDDVLALSDAFLVELARGLGTPPAGISRDARQLLMEYHWPGNVRELRNVLERASILCDGGLITAEHLALNVVTQPTAPPPSFSSAPAVPATAAAQARVESAGDLQAIERDMIDRALQSARFNKSKAAEALGLTRHQLYIRMRKHGLH